ncbi:MAG: SUMF1/EgtB/PvdO family nonheme iron enzyme, partial [Chloroflexota bacterium]
FKYPYDPTDGRENLEAGYDVRQVLRGGSFLNYKSRARCAYRGWDYPRVARALLGFRVCVSPTSPAYAL